VLAANDLLFPQLQGALRAAAGSLDLPLSPAGRG
jgi:hypothetical protein